MLSPGSVKDHILFTCNSIEVLSCGSYGSNQEEIELWTNPSVAPANFGRFTQNIETNKKEKMFIRLGPAWGAFALLHPRDEKWTG